MFSLIFNGCFNNDLASMARLAFQDEHSEQCYRSVTVVRA